MNFFVQVLNLDAPKIKPLCYDNKIIKLNKYIFSVNPLLLKKLQVPLASCGWLCLRTIITLFPLHLCTVIWP